LSETRDPSTDQPLPTPNDQPHIHDLVADDIAARKALGIRKYRTPLQAYNGRNMLRDAYEEVLDLAVYLRGALAEQGDPIGVTSQHVVRLEVLEGVKGRYWLARMAGEHAQDGGKGWDEATILALTRSWQDIPTLMKMLEDPA